MRGTSAWLPVLMSYVVMLIVSFTIMLVAGRGKLRRYGFASPSRWRLANVLAWGLGIGTLSTLLQAWVGAGDLPVATELTFVQVILLIWCLASVAEEIFFRGLIQTALGALQPYGVHVFGIRLSLPVFLGGALFALVHLVQSAMGAGVATVAIAVGFALLLGLAAGYHRERSGSLVPAILVHALANVGGSITGLLLGAVAR